MDTGRKEPIGKNNLRITQVAGLDVILRTMRAGGETVIVNGGEAPPLQQETASETVYALVATTANIVSIGTAGLIAVDGVTTPANTLIMVRAQTTEAENGIYEARADGWRKVSTDGDKFLVFVGAGLTYGNTLWFTSDGINFYRPRADILDASVTDNQIGTRTADDSLSPATGGIFLTLTQKLTPFLSIIFSMLKAITGKSAGNIAPDITLAATKAHVDASAPHAGHEATANKNAASGYAGLDATSKIATSQIPPITSAMIQDGTIVNADINSAAGITGNKIASLTITGSVGGSGNIANATIIPANIALMSGAGAGDAGKAIIFDGSWFGSMVYGFPKAGSMVMPQPATTFNSNVSACLTFTQQGTAPGITITTTNAGTTAPAVDGVSTGGSPAISGTGNAAGDAGRFTQGAAATGSAVYVDGSIRYKQNQKNAAFTADQINHDYPVDTTGAAGLGAIAVTLPAIANTPIGRAYFFYDEANNANIRNININRAGADVFIGGAVTKTINAAGDGIMIIRSSAGKWAAFKLTRA